MVESLKPPRRKNPLRRARVPAQPPQARSRAALAFTARAAEGRFALQKCGECGAIAYPPRDVCGRCWADALAWAEVTPGGVFLAETVLHTSTNVYFRERMPWRIGAIQLDVGPTVVAHIHADAKEGERVLVSARTDKAGQGVFIALPEKETANMGDDKALRELTCDPKHRRILVTDVRKPIGQALVRHLLQAGAAKVFLGVSEKWRPFEGRDGLYSLPNTELAPLDLSDADSVIDLASSIGGKVDILINTAQHVRPGSAMSRRDAVTARDEMELNYFGPLRLLQSFGPAMRGRGADGVNSAVAWMNVLSVYALSNWPTYGLSAASQAAALSLSQCARGDFAGSGVKVVNVFHGPIDDEWHQPLPPPKVTPESLAGGIINALRQGVEQTFVGDVAKDIEMRWREDPGLLERELILARLMD